MSSGVRMGFLVLAIGEASFMRRITGLPIPRMGLYQLLRVLPPPTPSCLVRSTPVEPIFDTRSSPVSLVPRLAAYAGKLTHREQQVSPVCPSDLVRYSILLGHSARVRVSPPCRTLMAQRPALDVRGRARPASSGNEAYEQDSGAVHRRDCERQGEANAIEVASKAVPHVETSFHVEFWSN